LWKATLRPPIPRRNPCILHSLLRYVRERPTTVPYTRSPYIRRPDQRQQQHHHHRCHHLQVVPFLSYCHHLEYPVATPTPPIHESLSTSFAAPVSFQSAELMQSCANEALHTFLLPSDCIEIETATGSTSPAARATN
jgi:hypothetical protein